MSAAPVPAPPPASVRREAAAGLRLSAAAGLGLFPLGVAFGMLVLQAGLPWWTAPLLSLVVFAGSVELLLVGLITAATPLPAVALTVFLVNFRHVFYAFSFPLRVVRGPFARLYAMGALIDEAYAIAAAHPRGWTAPRLLAMQAALQAYWVGGGLVGVGLAALLPAPVRGLEFALVALFLVLALDAVRTRRQAPLALTAAAAVAVALALAPGQVLVTAFALYAAALLGAHVLASRGHTLGLPEPHPTTGPAPSVPASSATGPGEAAR